MPGEPPEWSSRETRLTPTVGGRCVARWGAPSGSRLRPAMTRMGSSSRLVRAAPRSSRPCLVAGSHWKRPTWRIRTLALVGTEGGGLERALDESADMRISIPMRRRVDSLNVAVATALIVYEARRQRASAPAAEAS